MPSDRQRVEQLVTAAGLPIEGLDRVWRTWVATIDGQVIGTASLECHHHALLLRSVTVAASVQRCGVGSHIIEHVLAQTPTGSSIAL
jgi:N-acetylglutamate synthase-like GNAT family acetyltransferase